MIGLVKTNGHLPTSGKILAILATLYNCLQRPNIKGYSGK